MVSIDDLYEVIYAASDGWSSLHLQVGTQHQTRLCCVFEPCSTQNVGRLVTAEQLVVALHCVLHHALSDTIYSVINLVIYFIYCATLVNDYQLPGKLHLRRPRCITRLEASM